MARRFRDGLARILLAGSLILAPACGGSGGGSGGGGNGNSTPTTTTTSTQPTTTTTYTSTTTTTNPSTTTTTSVPTTTSSTTTTTQPNENHSPQFTMFPNPDATEGELYQINIFYNDADGDDVECSFVQNPFGAYASLVPDGVGKCKLTIDTPQDDVSGQNNFVKVKLDDGKVGGTTEQGKNIYVNNTETASGWVGGFDTEDGLEGILVELDDGVNYYSALTDADGNWEIPGMLDGNFWFTMSDDSDEYLTYEAGKLQVSKAQQGNMDTSFMLLPKAIQDYVQSVIYGDGSGNPDNLEAIAKWMVKPHFKIYTKEYSTGNPVPQANLDLVKGAILTQLNQFVQGVWTFVYNDDPELSDIEFVNSVYPGGMPAEGDFAVNFDNSNSNTSISQTYADGSIKSTYTGIKASVGLPVVLQELSAGFINDGETKNDYYLDSVFWNNLVNPTATQYSEEDLICSMATYNPFWQRPTGTIFDLPSNSEVVPDNYFIN